MSMLTPSKNSKAPMNICNRCILDINNDLLSEFCLASQARRLLTALDNPCNIMVGHLAKKCTKCATGRHPCVLVEQPLWDTLKQVKIAREAHATAQRDANDQEEMDTRAQRATELGQQLIDELKQYNHNRKNFAGDRAMPRKRRGGAAQAGSNDETLAELQSIRRGILALVEVGKVVSIPSIFSRYALANRMRSTCATVPARRSSSLPSTLPWGQMPPRLRRRMMTWRRSEELLLLACAGLAPK